MHEEQDCRVSQTLRDEPVSTNSLLLVNAARVKRYIHDKYPGRRVSNEFLRNLDARLRWSIDHAANLGCNSSTMKDLNTMRGGV